MMFSTLHHKTTVFALLLCGGLFWGGLSAAPASSEIDKDSLTDWNIALFDAIYHNEPRRVVDLLKEGIDLNVKNAKGQNAIEFARFMAHPEIARLLEIYQERLQQLSRGIEVRFGTQPAGPPKGVEGRVFNEAALQEELAKLNAPAVPVFEEEEAPQRLDPADLQEESVPEEADDFQTLETEIRQISGQDFRSYRPSEFVAQAGQKIQERQSALAENRAYNLFEGFFKAFSRSSAPEILVVERKAPTHSPAPTHRPPDKADEQEREEFVTARKFVITLEEDVPEQLEKTPQTHRGERQFSDEDLTLKPGFQITQDPVQTRDILFALDLTEALEQPTEVNIKGRASDWSKPINETPPSVEQKKSAQKSKEIAPEKAPQGELARKMVIEIVRTPKPDPVVKVVMPLPMAEQDQSLSPKSRRINRLHLGDQAQHQIGATPVARTECFSRQKRQFCLEELRWPDEWAAVFEVTTSLPLGGTRALVRYEEEVAASFHVFFESEHYLALRRYFESVFGPPSHVWQRKRRTMIDGVIPFEVVAWQSENDQILELIQSADYRKLGLKEGHGALRLVDVADRETPLSGIRQSDLMILGTKRLRSGR